jgi:hypothetical protein
MLRLLARCVGTLLGLWAAFAQAEPYLAVQTGLRCAMCHVNQTGGGMRTPFGNQFAQKQLAANPLGDPYAGWDGRLNEWIGVGANLRADGTTTRIGGERQTRHVDWQEARAYLQLGPVQGVSGYIDQVLGPGPSTNREAFVMYRPAGGEYHVKAGRIYLPFGWRLQDTSALASAVSSIDMIGPDRGIELGWDRDALSLQFAVSNGSFGKKDVDNGKQYSLQAAWIEGDWRAGAAYNLNDQRVGRRQVFGLFGGLRTGPVAWLGEIVAVEDRSSTSATGRTLRSQGGLLEGNWLVMQGHNLKLTLELLDPDLDRRRDLQDRTSLVYEYTPVGFLQLRAGWRRYGGPSGDAVLNRQVGFAELHALF